MADAHYDVLFRGEILEGRSREEVLKNFAETLRKDSSNFEQLFSGGTYVVGKDLPQADADALAKRFQAMGALAYLRQRDTPGARIEEPRVPEPTPTHGPEAKSEPTPTHGPEAKSELAASPAATATPSPSRASSWRYRFDTYMAKGGASIFGALVVTFVGLFVLIGATRGLLQWLAPETTLQYENLDFLGNLYITFLQLTDPGNMAQDILSSPGYKLFAVLAGLSGVIMLSALIAFITTALDQKISDLKRGRSKVIEAGHTLILGWNEQRIIEVVRELTIANESEPDACVVILADKDKEEMDDILRLRLPDRATTRIVTRSGTVSTLANLDMVSIETCKSVIALGLCGDTDDDTVKAASDAMVIQTILATTGKGPDDEDFCIVAEIYNPSHREVVESSFPEHVVTVNTSDILAKLLVQTSRSVGLSVVYNEILSFDGCELYFHQDDWGDVDFETLSYRFPDGVPMGLRRGDGEIVMNPPGDTRLHADDEILILADDDSTIDYQDAAVATARDLPLADRRLEQSIERELVLGWNHKAPIILREFADYVRPGSQVDVLLNGASEADRREIEALSDELETLEVRLVEADCMNRAALIDMRPFEYDNIIILAGRGSSDGTDVQQIDSENIVRLLLLRGIFSEHVEETHKTKLITEVLDSQNYPLVARAGVKDVIISNRLVSMIMAQISESRDIKKVYDDIFQEDGSEIYLKPASLYFDAFPAEVSFADLMALARKRSEVCIGVKTTALESDNEHNNGVQLIPEKNTRFTVVAEDCLIVLAEDEL